MIFKKKSYKILFYIIVVVFFAAFIIFQPKDLNKEVQPEKIGLNLENKDKPNLSSPPNVTIKEPIPGTYGPAPLLINASITDSDSSVYNVKAMVNATPSFNISMIKGSGDYWSCYWGNISDYSSGDYEIRIWANDTNSEVNQTVFRVITIDTTDPTWDEEPTNQGIPLGDSFYYDVNASDSSGFVSYWVNDTGNFTINANGEITNVSTLKIGVYWIRINASDPYGNNLTKVISISVTDTTAPTWDEIPQDRPIEFGVPFYYNLNASDAQTVFYYVNDTGNFTMDINTGELTNNTVLAVGSYPIEVRASDGTNDNITIIIITVEDTTTPTWDEMPQDRPVEFGVPFYYNLNASDARTVFYYVNDTGNFTMDINTGELTNNTVLTVGSYPIEVRASDGINNNITIIIITVEDTTAPTWDEIPQDRPVEFGVPFYYNLNASDARTVFYYVNDTGNFTMDINTGELTNNTVLAVGSYPIEVRASDGTNDNITIIIITVEDTTAPTWDEMPQDRPVEFGVPFYYNLNASDARTVFYYVNDTGNFTMDINTGELTNNTVLTVGSYPIEVRASDGTNNNITIIIITVEDTTVPTWDEMPQDRPIEFGVPFYYNLNASDARTVFYYVNDTGNFTMDINTGELTNNTVLAVGSYPIEVRASDGINNNITIIIITVEDTSAPTWDEEPTNQGIPFGDSFYYDVNASDPSGIASYWVNDTGNFEINTNGEIWNVSTLTFGVYWIRINASDPYGNNLTKVISISVTDTTAPTWDEIPQDRPIEFGVPFYYNLNASDAQTVFYYVNDTGNFTMDINTGELTNNTVLAVGSYPIEVRASDGTNDNITIIIITVEDTITPTWDEMPQDRPIEFGVPFYYNLNASDARTVFYYVNDTGNFTMDINTGELTNNTVLALGSYPIEVRASDGINDNITIIIITVEDTTTPTWDEIPQDRPIEFGVPFYYNLNASDARTVFYYVNDTGNFTMDINTGELTNNTVLAVGSYPIEVRASDGINDNITIIIITVEDTSAPTWDEEPTNQGIPFGDSFYYDVNASDPSGIASYWVNDTGNFEINTNGEIWNVSTLTFGVYWIRINASDPYGNNLTKVISISVADMIAPEWDEIPQDRTIEFGDPFYYDLNASDFQTVYYYVNDTGNFTMDINTGELTNNTVLAVGSYPIEVRASDGTNDNITIIIIIVEDTTAPTWDEPLTDQTAEFPSPFYYDVNASDPSGIASYWVNDTGNFEINANGNIWNVSTLTIGGVYWIRINASDAYGNNITDVIKIDYFRDELPPKIEFVAPLINGTITQTPYTIIVNITDDYHPPMSGNVTIMFFNRTMVSLFNASMTEGAGTLWLFGWINISLYNNREIIIRVFAIDNAPIPNSNTSISSYVSIKIPELPPAEEGDDDDGKKSTTKEVDIFTEFWTDLTTNPLNLFTKTSNLIILGVIFAVIIGITVFIKKRKGYKTSRKETERILEIMRD